MHRQGTHGTDRVGPLRFGRMFYCFIYTLKEEGTMSHSSCDPKWKESVKRQREWTEGRLTSRNPVMKFDGSLFSPLKLSSLK